MQAKDFMTKNVISIGEKQTVKEAAKLMTEKNFSVLPVVNGQGELVGIITESDFVGKEIKVPHALASIKQLFGQTFYFDDIEKIYAKSKEQTIDKIMTKNPHTVEADASLTDVVNFMIRHNLKRIPVVKGGKVEGIITRKNILNAFINSKP